MRHFPPENSLMFMNSACGIQNTHPYYMDCCIECLFNYFYCLEQSLAYLVPARRWGGVSQCGLYNEQPWRKRFIAGSLYIAASTLDNIFLGYFRYSTLDPPLGPRETNLVYLCHVVWYIPYLVTSKGTGRNSSHSYRSFFHLVLENSRDKVYYNIRFYVVATLL